MIHTPGILRVGTALPDPPFEFMTPSLQPAGFDIDFMQAIAKELGLRWELSPFEATNFEDIFIGLNEGLYDVVASGATITEHRKSLSRFCSPYLRSGQSLVVNVEREPEIKSIDHLTGKVIGVQHGNTSESVVRELKKEKKVAEVKIYAYNEILKGLDDLEEGHISAFMKLEPVMRWFTKSWPHLKIVQTGITHELLAVAVQSSNEQLATAIEKGQKLLAARGELAILSKKWFPSSDPRETEVLA